MRASPQPCLACLLALTFQVGMLQSCSEPSTPPEEHRRQEAQIETEGVVSVEPFSWPDGIRPKTSGLFFAQQKAGRPVELALGPTQYDWNQNGVAELIGLGAPEKEQYSLIDLESGSELLSLKLEGSPTYFFAFHSGADLHVAVVEESYVKGNQKNSNLIIASQRSQRKVVLAKPRKGQFRRYFAGDFLQDVKKNWRRGVLLFHELQRESQKDRLSVGVSLLDFSGPNPTVKDSAVLKGAISRVKGIQGVHLLPMKDQLAVLIEHQRDERYRNLYVWKWEDEGLAKSRVTTGIPARVKNLVFHDYNADGIQDFVFTHHGADPGLTAIEDDGIAFYRGTEYGSFLFDHKFLFPAPSSLLLVDRSENNLKKQTSFAALIEHDGQFFWQLVHFDTKLSKFRVGKIYTGPQKKEEFVGSASDGLSFNVNDDRIQTTKWRRPSGSESDER